MLKKLLFLILLSSSVSSVAEKAPAELYERVQALYCHVETWAEQWGSLRATIVEFFGDRFATVSLERTSIWLLEETYRLEDVDVVRWERAERLRERVERLAWRTATAYRELASTFQALAEATHYPKPAWFPLWRISQERVARHEPGILIYYEGDVIRTVPLSELFVEATRAFGGAIKNGNSTPALSSPALEDVRRTIKLFTRMGTAMGEMQFQSFLTNHPWAEGEWELAVASITGYSQFHRHIEAGDAQSMTRLLFHAMGKQPQIPGFVWIAFIPLLSGDTPQIVSDGIYQLIRGPNRGRIPCEVVLPYVEAILPFLKGGPAN